MLERAAILVLVVLAMKRVLGTQTTPIPPPLKGDQFFFILSNFIIIFALRSRSIFHIVLELGKFVYYLPLEVSR